MNDGTRIVVASDDGRTVRRKHFGSAPVYVVFEVQGGIARRVEERGPVPEKPGHGHGEALAVLAHLADCTVFVGGSMGRRSRELLDSRGIRTVVTDATTVEDAIERLMAGPASSDSA